MDISYSERVYIKEGVEQNVRNDGRARLDYRFFALQTDVIPHANGSARLKLNSTEVLVAVKCELAAPSPTQPAQGQVHVDVACAVSVLAGEAQKQKALESQLTAELSLVAEQGNGIDLPALCVLKGKAVWHVYIDAMVLCLGGNVVDALGMATYAAVETATLPRLQVEQSGEEEDKEAEIRLGDDPYDVVKLPTQHMPILLSLYKIGACFVVDPSLEEEQCVAAWLRVAVNQQGKLCGISKGGWGSLAPNALLEMIKYALLIGTELLSKVRKQIAAGSGGAGGGGAAGDTADPAADNEPIELPPETD